MGFSFENIYFPGFPSKLIKKLKLKQSSLPLTISLSFVSSKQYIIFQNVNLVYLFPY